MERDCFVEGTPICLDNGLSVSIETMKNCGHKVLGWDNQTDGMVSDTQTNFLYKGEQECVELIYEDGRTQICTKEHKLLSRNNKWISAEDLEIGQDQLKISLNNPHVNIEKEIELCVGWSLKVGDITLKTDSHNEYMKTLAFSRILGYLITDGTISSKTNGQICSYIYLGHMIDVMSIVNDLKLFCNITQTNFEHKKLYAVYLPQKFVKNIIQLDGILIGKKSNQPASLPSFILDKKCPVYIIREFLGGLFGGDGHTSYMLKRTNRLDSVTSLSFSQSKSKKYITSLTEMLTNLQILLGKCGINNTTIQKPKKISYSKNNNDSYEQLLHIAHIDMCMFSKNIGFRYCCHKSMRLEASRIYKNFKKYNNVKISSSEYFDKINALDFFRTGNYGVSRNRISLPTMYLTVVKRTIVGYKKVYDIQVDKTESFLANGIISHNCMIAHGASRFLKERLFDCSDPYQITVCDHCGMIISAQNECRSCHKDNVTTVNIPYAAKLLLNELGAMGIKTVIKAQK
jgi:hypothetical protein